ncbi:MAG TPA: bifunctional UDP-N-acetylglucosamine diphosphorylase/glucosamine-1-phosphate N-acetyltransferase GlmU [Xanthobacteraceae bacterium]|nr:bifunctional UDP-N-acetylglucosamine diphosphorylase/glucosamine-1-phosphate N-acetyltransferase GlmU [Xanthobacteraceae bacterium]
MAAKTAIVVLAAGEGTRMASAQPKVLHALGGRLLIAYALEAAGKAGADKIAVVVGPDHKRVAAEVKRLSPQAQIFVQRERRGTADALLAAKAMLAEGDDVVVLFGDTPLVRAETLRAVRDGLKHAAVSVLGFRPANPTGYGRLVIANGRLTAIREERDASAAERAIRLCNAGVMALAGKHALEIVRAIGNRNAKHEFYLSDAVAIAADMGLAAAVSEAPEEEVMGINDRKQLAEAEAVLQRRLRERAMEAGATLLAPETVYFSPDTKLGSDVTVEPYVVFGPGVVVDDKATVRSFCHIEGAHIAAGAVVGPFARLRPGTAIGPGAHIGNFVEVKAATFGKDAKANHLAYIGDGSVGDGANIGAGTIFCNYDGQEKHRTEVGKDAFIGSNSALVAPVKVGEGAYVGTGSVIVKDVPAEALAVARARQTVKKGWAKKLHAIRKLRVHKSKKGKRGD